MGGSASRRHSAHTTHWRHTSSHAAHAAHARQFYAAERVGHHIVHSCLAFQLGKFLPVFVPLLYSVFPLLLNFALVAQQLST